MVQGGFSIFFLLVALAGLFSLVRLAREQAHAIAAALAGVAPAAPAPARRARFRQRPTAEAPFVRRRLRSLVEEALAPVGEPERVWCFRRSGEA